MGVDFAGQGCMSRALRAASPMPFNNLRLRRLEAACLPETQHRSGAPKRRFPARGCMRGPICASTGVGRITFCSPCCGDPPPPARRSHHPPVETESLALPDRAGLYQSKFRHGMGRTRPPIKKRPPGGDAPKVGRAILPVHFWPFSLFPSRPSRRSPWNRSVACRSIPQAIDLTRAVESYSSQGDRIRVSTARRAPTA